MYFQLSDIKISILISLKFNYGRSVFQIVTDFILKTTINMYQKNGLDFEKILDMYMVNTRRIDLNVLK